MAVTFYLSPISLLIQAFSNVGIPLGGGSVAVYLAGTTTPVTTYTDSTGGTPNANPIALSPAGRLQSAGGAPVACWVPGGTAHKMVISDASSQLILQLDNLTGINDQAALSTALLNPATGFGVDLVANAMKSYDIFASVRAANVPNLAAGQTLIIDTEGAMGVGDGLGGEFYWSASSTAVDDGATVLQPTAAGATGRYLRLVAPATSLPPATALNATGSFTAVTTDVTGGTTSATIFYTKVGQMVTLVCPTSFGGTSASTAFTLSGMPALLFPARQQQQVGVIGACQDNTVACGAVFNISTGGILTALKVTPSTLAIAGTWTGTGTKSLGTFNLTYGLG
jgi:hypothetical protein